MGSLLRAPLVPDDVSRLEQLVAGPPVSMDGWRRQPVEPRHLRPVGHPALLPGAVGRRQRLREVLPDGVRVTVVADRGFADCKLFYALTTELGFEYVIRLRGDIYVTNARGERRVAAEVGRRRRACAAAGGSPGDRRARDAGGRGRLCPRCEDGREARFRDIKDIRFGMGLSSMHVLRPDRRDRLLLLSALAIAVLSVLGAGGRAHRVRPLD